MSPATGGWLLHTYTLGVPRLCWRAFLIGIQFLCLFWRTIDEQKGGKTLIIERKRNFFKNVCHCDKHFEQDSGSPVGAMINPIFYYTYLTGGMNRLNSLYDEKSSWRGGPFALRSLPAITDCLIQLKGGSHPSHR